MRVRLLGPVSARTDHDVAVNLGGTKQRSVFAQLCLEPNVAVTVDRLAEGVWGEQVPSRYRQNLQVYVSTLRRAIEPERRPGTPSRIVGHGEAYELVVGEQEIDLLKFSRQLAIAEQALESGRPKAALDRLLSALDLWSQPPFVDLVAEPFAVEWLPRLEQRQLTAREHLVTARMALGQHEAVIDELQTLVAEHPTRESLWGELATAFVRCGRQADALAALQEAREHLSEELGLDPGPQLQALHTQILRQDPVLLGQSKPVLTTSAVPLPLTAAIGRDALVADVVDRLLAGTRLVTLVGPGGVGKTRVSLEVAKKLKGSATDVQWVGFADEPPTASVQTVVARVMNLPQEDLGEVLDAGPLILIVDNVEHVLAAAPGLGALLVDHPTLQLLVTSRGHLGVHGEQVLPVPALDDHSSAQLFAERARAVSPTFDLDTSRDSVVELCRRVDGLPLGIELIAARTGVLSPEQLLESLPSLVNVGGDPHGRPERHHSVERAVAWSLDLVTPAEASLLAALSALEGSVDLHRVQVVARVLTPSGDHSAHQAVQGSNDLIRDVPHALETLVRAALVQPVESDAGRRFLVLATVREVARAREHAPSTDEVLMAVAQDWLSQEVDVITPRGPAELSDVRADLPLIGDVVNALLLAGRAEDAARVVLARRRALFQLGRQRDLLRLAMSVLAASPTPPWAARLAVVAGSAAYVCNEISSAAELLDTLDDLQPDDQLFQILGYSSRGVLRADEGDHDAALADVETAVHVASQLDQPLALRLALSAGGWAATQRGDHAAALDYARAALPLASDDTEAVFALVDLARAELAGGNGAAALAVTPNAVARGRRLGGTFAFAEALQAHGCALIDQGRYTDGALVLCEALGVDGASSDEGWILETAAGLALALVGAGAEVDGLRLMAGLDQRVHRLLGAERALGDELQPAAHALGVLSGAGPPALPRTTDELVTEAVSLAREMSLSASS